MLLQAREKGKETRPHEKYHTFARYFSVGRLKHTFYFNLAATGWIHIFHIHIRSNTRETVSLGETEIFLRKTSTRMGIY